MTAALKRDWPDRARKRRQQSGRAPAGTEREEKEMKILICLIDRKLYLRENLVVLPLEYL